MNLEERAAIICQAGSEEFEKLRKQLVEVFLVSSAPELVMRGTQKSLTAEFRIEFLHEGQLVDILEFFVCREGNLVSSEEEMRQWVREDVSDVIERQNTRLQTRHTT